MKWFENIFGFRIFIKPALESGDLYAGKVFLFDPSNCHVLEADTLY